MDDRLRAPIAARQAARAVSALNRIAASLTFDQSLEATLDDLAASMAAATGAVAGDDPGPPEATGRLRLPRVEPDQARDQQHARDAMRGSLGAGRLRSPTRSHDTKMTRLIAE